MYDDAAQVMMRELACYLSSCLDLADNDAGAHQTLRVGDLHGATERQDRARRAISASRSFQ
jgi:hypothetical protein